MVDLAHRFIDHVEGFLTRDPGIPPIIILGPEPDPHEDLRHADELHRERERQCIKRYGPVLAEALERFGYDSSELLRLLSHAEAGRSNLVRQCWEETKISLQRAIIHLRALKEEPSAANTVLETPLKQKQWTQSLVDNEVRKYFASNIVDFNRFKSAITNRSKTAIKEARKKFGRNAVAREIKSGKTMVGKSGVWRAYAEMLKLVEPKETGRPRAVRTGNDWAVEEASESAYKETNREDEEMAAVIDRLPESDFRTLLKRQFEDGEITHEQVREKIKDWKAQIEPLAREQEKDDLERNVSRSTTSL